MKIVNVIGGLGNQMFQYAFAVALKDKYPQEEVLLDISHFHSVFFKKYKGRNLHYGYELDKVLEEIPFQKAKWWQIARLSYYVPNYLLSRFVRRYFPQRKSEYLEKLDYTYDPDALQQDREVYYEGYWQVSQYYEDAGERIRTAFKFRAMDAINLALIGEMKEKNSVAIHVRRGDYINNKGFGGICTLEYYQKAIALVLNKIEKPIFYVFSNDIKWCEDNLIPLLGDSKCHFVNHNTGSDSYKDMELISYCKVNVIANSSFSWWGAFLNKNKNVWVIAPTKWNNFFSGIDIYPKDWTLV